MSKTRETRHLLGNEQLVLLRASTGFGQSEAQALKWSDSDFAKKIKYVQNESSQRLAPIRPIQKVEL
jgi:hypothetical protein